MLENDLHTCTTVIVVQIIDGHHKRWKVERRVRDSNGQRTAHHPLHPVFHYPLTWLHNCRVSNKRRINSQTSVETIENGPFLALKFVFVCFEAWSEIVNAIKLTSWRSRCDAIHSQEARPAGGLFAEIREMVCPLLHENGSPIPSDEMTPDVRKVVGNKSIVVRWLLLDARAMIWSQCCRVKFYGTPTWKTSKRLLVSHEEVITSVFQRNYSEFIIQCKILIEVVSEVTLY